MEMIDDEDNKDKNHNLVFKCISHLFSSYFQRVKREIPPSPNDQNIICFPPQVQIRIGRFETGVTSACTR